MESTKPSTSVASAVRNSYLNSQLVGRVIIVAMSVALVLSGCRRGRGTVASTLPPSPQYRPTRVMFQTAELSRALLGVHNAPTSVKARFQLGMSLYKCGKYTEAIPELKTVFIHGTPKARVVAGAFLSFSLRAVGRNDDALYYLRELLKTDRHKIDQSDLLTQIGEIKLQQNDLAGGWELFQQAIHINNRNDDALYYCGYLNRVDGDLDFARKDAQDAIRLSRSTATASLAHTLLGMLFEDQGKLSDSKREYTLAEQIDPTNNQAPWHLDHLKLVGLGR